MAKAKYDQGGESSLGFEMTHSKLEPKYEESNLRSANLAETLDLNSKFSAKQERRTSKSKIAKHSSNVTSGKKTVSEKISGKNPHVHTHISESYAKLNQEIELL